MILRSISKHVSDQNWFAVFIDFLIVVVGVFIGIQVANWNEDLAGQEKEKIYYEQLIEDLQFDAKEYSEAISVTEWRMVAIHDINLTVTGKIIPKKFSAPNFSETLLQELPKLEIGEAYPAAIGYIDTFDGSSSAYQSLLSTGDIGLITNQTLLRQIQLYYSEVGSLQKMEERLIVFRDQTVALRSEAGIGGANLMTLDQIALIVQENPNLLASINSLWHFSAIQRMVLNSRISDAQELIKMIQQELK